MTQTTDNTTQYFIDIIKDMGNWSGTPLFGGNIDGSNEAKGYLMNLKKRGLVETFDDGTGCCWIELTKKGHKEAAALGYDTTEF